MKRPVEDSLSLLTGLGVGAVLAPAARPVDRPKAARQDSAKKTRRAVHSSEAKLSGLGHRAYDRGRARRVGRPPIMPVTPSAVR